jgi:purine-binding chemotaxis protein CheW
MTLQPTPEAYFQALDLDPGAQGALTPQEAAFLRRYAGLLADTAPTPKVASPVSASAAEPKALPTAPAEVPEKAPAISRSETLRLVAFAVAGHQFLLPVGDVQEVVPYQTPTRLPAAPAHIAGIVQLRGRITPIIRLHELLELPPRPEDRERFFIICEAHGIQLGLVAHALAPMIQAPAENVDWHVHEHLGDTSDLVQGICKHNGKLTGILSVAALTQIILEPQPGGHHGPPHPHRG